MTNISIRSFTGGEISPSLYARVDLSKYQSGLRTCKNFIIQRHGGASNRPGTQFIGEVSDSSNTVRLIPFIFNNSQTYMLEFGDQYMRVIQNGAHLSEAAKTITGVTQADPAVVSSTSHGYTNGDEVFISGVSGMTELNNRNFKVANVAANTFEITSMSGTDIDSSAYAAYSSGGSAFKIYEIATPYLVADLPTLQFVQSADIVTIVHPTYAPRELARTGHTSWTLSSITFAPTIATPTGQSNGGGVGTTYSWVITAVEEETYQESLQSTATESSTNPTSTPVVITWTAVSGAQEYNVYRFKNGVYAFIGTASSNTFTDDGITPDTTKTPPISRNPFSGADDYPSAVNYFQQRLTFANTNNKPETTFASKSGSFKNFTISSPLQSDDAVTYTLAGRQVNEIKHLIDVGKLITLTSGAEWSVNGGSNGVLTPTDINANQQSYYGSSDLRPIIIDGTVLFVQARGATVRSLSFDDTISGYRGGDMTIFSTHLFESFTIVDWAYQSIPNSVVWAVRSDGVLLGLTYIREHDIWAWHQHEFENGTVENVSVIPEGDEDFLYLVIKRTINGETRRYVERMASRFVSTATISDAKFMDSYLAYDGTNTTAINMTLSGGTDWTYLETLTLTASSSFFSASDVGNSIHLTGSDGTEIRCSITAYTSATVVSIKPHKTVPVSMRSVAINSWGKAVDQLSGLWHLEGQDVSVFADAFVVANPNNPTYDTVTVTNGIATLDDTYVKIAVGLPVTSDIETLDIDSVEGESISDKKKRVNRVTMFVESSRGLFAGNKAPTGTNILEDLQELQIREDEDYDSPIALKTGVVDVNILPEWNSNGRVFIRQTDPLPLSILAVVPAGLYPFRNRE
jgi:hypothetical protein